MYDDDFVKPDIDALMEGAFSRFSPDVRSLLMQQGPYIKQSFGQAPYGGFTALVGLLIVGDNSTSMKGQEILSEMEQAQGVTPKRLYQRLIQGLNEGVIDGLRESSVAKKIEILLDVLNPNADYIRGVTGGPSHFEWRPVLGETRHFVDDYSFLANGNHTDGGTPLRRRIVQSIASGLVRSYWLSQPPHNLPSTFKYLFMTDGESTEVKRQCVQPHQVEALLAELPSNHQPYFLGLENDRVVYRDVALGMGFPDDRIEELPPNGEALRHYLKLWSQTQAESADAAPVDDGELVATDDDDFLSNHDPFAGDDELGLGDDDFVGDNTDDDSDSKGTSAFGDWLS
jgi:hypothetical protein